VSSRTRPKSQKSEVEPLLPLTREGLLVKYGITDRTLRRLTDQLRLCTLPEITQHGRVRYQIDPKTDLILHAGKFCPYSFPLRRPPFLRYVLLGLLTSSDAEILAGLEARGVLNRTIDAAWLKEARSTLSDSFPTLLRPFIEQQLEPQTDFQKNLHRILLDIAGISAAYDTPGMVDQFYWADHDLLQFVQQILLTHTASLDTKAEIINHVAQAETLSPEGLMFWEALFHDSAFMSPEDFDWYVKTLPPVLRRAYRDSAELSTREWLVLSNTHKDREAEAAMVGEQLRRRAMTDIKSDDPNAFMRGLRAMAVAVRLNDFGLQDVSGKEAKPAFLTNLLIDEYAYEDRFSAKDQAPATESGSG